MHRWALAAAVPMRYIIRILLMVPIYAVNAWVAMVIPDAGLYLDSSREVYESFVIYSFMKYLFNFLHYDTNLQQYIDHKPAPAHIFPLCCLPTCVGGKSFMRICKHGILQYVIVRPLTTLITFVSQQLNFYGEGNYNPLSGYTFPIILIVNNASQITAMYCLVIFYTGYQQELYPMKPLGKFISIKLVVFFSFFQMVVISGLMELQSFKEAMEMLFPETKDKITLGRNLQDFLICIDMLIAAVFHQFTFSHEPFIDDTNDQLPLGSSMSVAPRSQISDLSDRSPTCCEALRNLFDFSDEKSDIREHFNQIYGRILRVLRRKQSMPAVVSSSNSPMGDNWMTSESGARSTNQQINSHANGVAVDNANNFPVTQNYQSIE